MGLYLQVSTNTIIIENLCSRCFQLDILAESDYVGCLGIMTHNFPGSSSAGESGSKWLTLHIRLDALGTGISVSGLILLVYGLTTGNVNGWGQPDVIATLAVGVCAVAIFAFVEVKVSSDPILPRYVWGDSTMVLGCAVAALTYAVWQGCNYLLTLELQSK